MGQSALQIVSSFIDQPVTEAAPGDLVIAPVLDIVDDILRCAVHRRVDRLDAPDAVSGVIVAFQCIVISKPSPYS